jgi:hypothetical protein
MKSRSASPSANVLDRPVASEEGVGDAGHAVVFACAALAGFGEQTVLIAVP